MLSDKRILDLYPLSPMQSGLLFQSLYNLDSDAYFIQGIYNFQGEVDPSVLRMAWQKVSDIHSILRTGFVWQDGEEAEQYVLESIIFPFIEYNWKELRKEQQQQEHRSFY